MIVPAPGIKHDQGKNRLGLVLGGFSRAVWAVGEVGTFGAVKYVENSWQNLEDGERRYTDAMLRHLMADLRGEERDAESGLLHLAHAAWCALAILDLRLKVMEPPPANSERSNAGCRENSDGGSAL